MRIALLGNCHKLGGGPTHFRLLFDFLVADGHEVRTIALADSTDEMPKATPPSAIFRLRWTADRPLEKLAKFVEFAGCIARVKAFGPELFIAVGYGGSYASFARLIGANCFRFYQELYLLPQGGVNGSNGVRLAQAQSFDAVAVQSPSMVEAFQSIVPIRKPVRSLPCFAPPVFHGPRAKRPEAGRALRLAYFGRLETNKGLVPFLQALSQTKEVADLSVDIHGEGGDRENIARAIDSMNLQERVRLRGCYPSDEAYARLLCEYHALVLPSVHSEGLPLVLLEAMSYGLPFLATSIGAIADSAIANPDAVIVDPTVQGLAAGLVTLATLLREGRSDPERQCRYYQQHFSQEVMADRWREMLAAPRKFFGEAKT